MPSKLIIILLLISIHPCYSQFSGYGNDQSWQSAVGLPKIDSLPPIKPDMKPENIISYNFIDSLARIIDFRSLDSNIRHCRLDTLKFLTAVNCFSESYDPLMIWSYILKSNSLMDSGKIYKTWPVLVSTDTRVTARRFRLNEIGKTNAFVAFTNYIFRIKIDSVVTGTDTTYENTHEWLNAAATIQKVYKGKPPCNCKINNNSKDFIIDSNNKSCLLLSYSFDASTNTGFDDIVVAKTFMKEVKKGEEYITFLLSWLISDTQSVICPDTPYDLTGGMFKIENGKVHDPSELWGMGKEINVEDLESQIMTKLEMIRYWLFFMPDGVEETEQTTVEGIIVRQSGNAITIELPDKYSSQTDIIEASLINYYGIELIKLKPQAGGSNFTFDLNNLPAGVYFVLINDGKKTVRHKFIHF